MIPEDLIFDVEKLRAICGELPNLEEIDDSKAKLKAISDDSGYDYEVIISILTTSFVKKKDENYHCILSMLKWIIEK